VAKKRRKSGFKPRKFLSKSKPKAEFFKLGRRNLGPMRGGTR
jgi:hypothetical protein